MRGTISSAPITMHWNMIDNVVAKLRRRRSDELELRRLSENKERPSSVGLETRSHRASGSQPQVSAACNASWISEGGVSINVGIVAS
jgi:hypothetical protein